MLKKTVSKAAASEDRKRTLQGYVEDLNDARATHGKRRVSARLGWAGEKSGFFSILPKDYLSVRTDWSAKLTRGLGKRPNKITPATAQANTKDKAGEVIRLCGVSEEGLGSRIYITITTRM